MPNARRLDQVETKYFRLLDIFTIHLFIHLYKIHQTGVHVLFLEFELFYWTRAISYINTSFKH